MALEATPHCGPITGLAVDSGGDLVFTVDSAGMILIQVLVARTGQITPEQEVRTAGIVLLNSKFIQCALLKVLPSSLWCDSVDASSVLLLEVTES